MTRARTLVAGLLVLVIIAGAVAIAMLAQRRGEIEDALDARRDAARVAERFVVQFNTYQPDQVKDYTATLNDLLSTSAQTAFSNRIEDITSLITQTKLSSQGDVLASGVASLDRDSARVLVVADAETDSVAGATQRHFRWEVDLVKVDGEWLVDDFSPVR
jgi:hypothetical protein